MIVKCGDIAKYDHNMGFPFLKYHYLRTNKPINIY